MEHLSRRPAIGREAEVEKEARALAARKEEILGELQDTYTEEHEEELGAELERVQAALDEIVYGVE